MTVKDIILKYLKENGYDGLCHNLYGCGCTLDNLMVCNKPLLDCQAGYMSIPNSEEENYYGNWIIKPEKEEIIQTNWIVFTGPPHSGKTTTCNEFKKIGWKIIPETARTIAESDKYARKNELEFQKRVSITQYKIETNLDPNKKYILDRAYPDTFAYHKLYGMSIKYIEKICKNKYKIIFIFEKLPNAQNDDIRIESELEMDQLFSLLLESYNKLGYNCCLVPAFSLQDRVQYISEIIRKLDF